MFKRAKEKKREGMLTSLILLSFNFLSHAQSQPLAASGKMDQLSPHFGFHETTSGGRLENTAPRGSLAVHGGPEEGFAVRFTVDIRPFKGRQTILEIPGVLSVDLRMADPGHPDGQNYPAFRMQDGSVPVLEASVVLHSDIKKPLQRSMRIGFPLAMLANPMGTHEVVLNFTGPAWTMYVDNQLRDNDFPIGYPAWPERTAWRIDPGFVKKAGVFFPAFRAERVAAGDKAPRPDVLFWTPRGHNSWVGDVATIYFNGRYHVFYLFDRRHHGSKFGAGGHYFEHFSTADFKTWTEHEAAVPIEAQWETIGTGTPFAYHDRLYLSYGLHTSRIYPDSLTMSPRMIDYYNKNHKTGNFRFDLAEAVPSGSSYAVSLDNASHFRKSGVLFHFCENPSVFVAPDGTLEMMANYHSRGTWRSAALDSGWQCIDEHFPLGGDCTFYFRWGRFEYVVGGFVNLWKRPVDSPDHAWEDLASEGKDFYNGINVPSISAIDHGRYLMAGWIPVKGWGGAFVAHELIQYPDGRLGTKWMKELTPDARDTVVLAERIGDQKSFPVKEKSFILSFEVYPQKKQAGRLALSFLSSGQEAYKAACAWQLDLATQTAQYSHASKEGFSAPEKSLRQGGSPQSVGDYAIEHLIGVGKPFKVRILVKRNAKLGGTVFDAEIAGQHTMISYRPGFNDWESVVRARRCRHQGC